jgi:hypothetical protein
VNHEQASIPVWLLDVDGVLNASRPGWGGPPHQGNAQHGAQAFRMRWAPALIVAVSRLHHDRRVEIRWATTWVDEIAGIENLMRLPVFPVAFSGLPDSPQTKTPGLKIEAALKVVEDERRPLIWTDDDAIPISGEQRDRLDRSTAPTLLIAPDPHRGLQPTDLDAIKAFLDRQPGLGESRAG